jgi:hypothetical protein
VSDTQDHDDAGPEAGSEQPDREQPEPQRLRLRRAPKYRAFGLTGLVAGVLIGLVLALGSAADGDYSQQTIAGYFAASFGLVGVLSGLGLAVLADRRRP